MDELEMRVEMETEKCKGRVLLVDGNWMVRDAAAMVLSREGYEVLIATAAKEGLELMRSATGRIDVVVSEMNFKGEMNGPTLLKALRKIDQELKCIFVSGYHEDTLRGMLDKDEAYAFLYSPPAFSPAKMTPPPFPSMMFRAM
jgi:two-component system cell cycle sensor histidine kinase/response regulator CckA